MIRPGTLISLTTSITFGAALVLTAPGHGLTPWCFAGSVVVFAALHLRILVSA